MPAAMECGKPCYRFPTSEGRQPITRHALHILEENAAEELIWKKENRKKTG